MFVNEVILFWRDNFPFKPFGLSFTFTNNVVCEVSIIPLMNVLKLTLWDETLERYKNSGKPIYMMGDFNINFLSIKTCNISKDFLISLQSNCCLPIIDEPTWV